MMTATVLILFCVLALLRVPVPLAMLAASLITLSLLDRVPLLVVPQYIIAGLTKFELLAVPFFILAAELMNVGGLTRRIFAFAEACVGQVRGGLAQVNILASVVFAGISGTAVADVAGLGRIEIQAMRQARYDLAASAAVTLASCVVGPLIPPSVVLIIYAITAEVSVGRMLLAGVGPGVLVAGMLMGYVYLLAWRRPESFPTVPAPDRRAWFRALGAGLPALAAPVIILLGFAEGVFTPTEAGVVACIYSFLVAILVYRELTLGGFLTALRRALYSSASVMFIIATASVIAWIVTRERSAMSIAAWLSGLTDAVWLQLLMVNAFLLLVGCLIEGVPALLILIPILLPVMTGLGVDPVHLGVIMILNIVIGIMTPPMGVGLFIMSSITGLSTRRIMAASAHYLIPLLLALAVVTAYPPLSLWLPQRLLGP